MRITKEWVIQGFDDEIKNLIDTKLMDDEYSYWFRFRSIPWYKKRKIKGVTPKETIKKALSEIHVEASVWRKKQWKEKQIIFSTPQGLENDIITNRIDLSEVSLLGVDESHRAVGDYAYVFLAKQYTKKAKFPRILGLTASPGSDMEKIKEVCNNLFIEDIEVRSTEDEDVKPYVKEIDIKWVILSVIIIAKFIFSLIGTLIEKYLYSHLTIDSIEKFSAHFTPKSIT